jgi:dihydroorotate dehydrogenase electron transfer subunit
MGCGGGGNCCKNKKKAEWKPLPQLMGRANDIPRTVKILDIKQENPSVKTFTLDISVGGRPGQFVNLWIPRVNEKPFSIAFDDGRTLQLSIAKVGPFTELLFEKKVGDKVGIRGPYGKVFMFGEEERVAVVGGGYGAAPLYFTAAHVIALGGTVEFFMGARSKDHLLFTERVEALEGANLHVATDDGSVGFEGYNATLLADLLKDGLKLDRILTVGPELMMKAVSNIALEYDIPCQLSVERYMKCGFGVCGQCVIDDSGMTTCMNGPVMDHKLARKHSEFGKYHRDSMGRKKDW